MAITDSTNPQTTIPGTPIQHDFSAIPDAVPSEPTLKAPELDLSLNLSPETQPVAKVDLDWLKEEDKATQEATATVSETPVVEAPKVEVAPEAPAPELTPQAVETIKENLPEGESADKDVLKSSLRDDMKIIKDIQATPSTDTTTQERVIEAKKPDVQVNPLNSSTINLDSLLADSAPQVAPTVPEAPVAPAATPVNNPFDLIQTNTPAEQVAQPAVTTTAVAAPTTVASKTKGVKIGLFIVLFVALGFFTYFIISTMYPMGLFSSQSTGQESITETAPIIEEDLLGTEIVDTQTGTTEDTGHASASDENFQDINDLMTDTTTTNTTLSQEAIVVQLNNYEELGTKYLQASKTANDLQSMKRALYLTKKAPALLNEIIANTDAITTMQSDIASQLTQFESFLQKLKEKYGDLSTTATQATSDQIFNSLTQE